MEFRLWGEKRSTRGLGTVVAEQRFTLLVEAQMLQEKKKVRKKSEKQTDVKVTEANPGGFLSFKHQGSAPL